MFFLGSVLAKVIKKADQEPLGFEQQMSVEAMPPKNERAKEKQWRWTSKGRIEPTKIARWSQQTLEILPHVPGT